MYCNSNFGFLNSFNNSCVIYAKVLAWPIGVVLCSFMYHTSAQPLKVVSNYIIFTTSSWTFFAAQIVSHTNRCCSGSFDPTPWNSGSLNVWPNPAILFCVVPPLGDVGLLWPDVLFPLLWLDALLPLLWLLLFWLPLLSISTFEKSSIVTSDLGDAHGVVDSTQDFYSLFWKILIPSFLAIRWSLS